MSGHDPSLSRVTTVQMKRNNNLNDILMDMSFLFLLYLPFLKDHLKTGQRKLYSSKRLGSVEPRNLT